MNATADAQLLFDEMPALPVRSVQTETAAKPELATPMSVVLPGSVARKGTARRRRNGGEVISLSPSEPARLEALLTFAEAAKALGISLRQFRRLVDGGKVAFVKVSERSPRVRPSELQRFLDASAVKYSEVQS